MQAPAGCSFPEPWAYVWYNHCLSVVSLPIGATALWLIVAKSPPHMQEMRANLIVNHCATWSFEILMFLITPEFYFPALSGRILGPWDTVFGLGVRQAFSLGGAFTMLTNASVSQLFTYKHQLLLSPGDRLKVSRRTWLLGMLFLYVFYTGTITLIIECFPFTDRRDSKAFTDMFRDYPCQLMFYNVPFVYAMTADPIPVVGVSIIVLFLCFVIFVVILNTAIIVLCVRECHKSLDAATFMSATTKLLQRKFISALCIQVCVPFSGFSIPWIYYTIVVALRPFDVYPPLNNLFFSIMCSHGFCASFFLIALNEPYRNVVLGKLSLRKGPNEGVREMTVITKVTAGNKSKAAKAAADSVIREQYLAADLEEMQRLLDESKQFDYRPAIVWRNVALFVFLHVGALVGVYHMCTVAQWKTTLFAFALWVVSGFGITAGAHRLWSHRSYKATLPARVFLMLCQTMAFQNDIIEWSRDHRCHHKWTDTDADPHNTRRGFFFAHMGWLLVKKHPQVKEQGKKLDLSDLLADPVCAFQRRYYLPLVALVCFLLPTAVPVYFWGESALVAYTTAALFRYCWTLHATWCVNSVAHYIGYKPYDPTITPVESVWTTVIAVGEGGHNFHHTFPQDYRTSEYSLKLNWTRLLIDGMAALGLVYDRKTTSTDAVHRQVAKHFAQ